MMDKVITCEQARMIAVSIFSTVMAFISPTTNFLLALVLSCAFNIWAGMRADGVTIIGCKNFSIKKFSQALWELMLYLIIVVLIYSVMGLCGDRNAAIIAVKSLTYVFMYVYVVNSFKNLIIAYPRKTALRVIYHVIRFEFKRAAPSHIKGIVERLENEFEKVEKNEIK